MAPGSSSNRSLRFHNSKCVDPCPGNGNTISSTNTAIIVPPTTETTVTTITSIITAPSNRTTLVASSTGVPIRSDSAALSNGAIVGISVGGSAFLILVFVLGILLWRYRQRKKVQEMKYTPWSRLNNADSSSSDHLATAATRSRPSNALSVLEIPIPTHYLFDSPVSIQSRSNPFRTSQTIDGRKLLKSLVPHDQPTRPQLQHYPSAYFEDVIPSPLAYQPSTSRTTGIMPVVYVTGSSNSSPSVYDSLQDTDELSHTADNPHMVTVTSEPKNISSIPASLQPRSSLGRNPAQIARPNKLPSEILPSPPPPAVTRTRSQEARAMAELIRAIDSPPLQFEDDTNNKRVSTQSSSGHISMRSETDGPIGLALTTPFTSSSLYAFGNISSRSSMTNTLFQRLTADFPLPPNTTHLPVNFDHSKNSQS